MSTYSFDCACGETMKVEAENDDSAVEMLMAAGKTHIENYEGDHPEMPPMEEMPAALRAGMQKMADSEMSDDSSMMGDDDSSDEDSMDMDMDEDEVDDESDSEEDNEEKMM